MSRAQDLETRRATMPLFNFQSDLDKIELGSNLWIREITRTEVESLQGSTTIIDGFEMSLITHALETEIPYEPKTINETNELFRTVVLSLRLFKSGNLYDKVTFFKRKGRKGRSASAFAWWKLIPYVSSRPYIFAEDEVDDFVTFLDRIESLNINETPDLKIPLHRFNKSYDDLLEEKFIDLMIAFESLVRPKRGNLREQVAIGVSMLIGKTSKERKTVRQDITEAYEVRNKIVHGVVLRIDRDKENLYYRAEDYLRRAILKTLG